MIILKFFKRLFRLCIDRHYKRHAVIRHSYRVQSLLGVGSYGTTYLCKDLTTNRICVVKQMTKSKRKKVIQEQFKQETTLLAQLNETNIPTLYDSFIFENTLFIAMEYMEGINLEDVLFLKKQRFSEKESLLLIHELMQILASIHSSGIVHGDIRIPNVILQDASKPAIIDFGLAKQWKSASDQSDPKANETKLALLREDFYDLGDLLLFLLYSNYDSGIKKGRPWTEELTLHPKTSHLLKRLLRMEKPYWNITEIMEDVTQAIAQLHSNKH
ncbi:serine/threonine protein kinase [Salipaludibacillus neizhouensis]|uniref:serine/threonine protein kinase n=1 Tax=Salipaludibacillus neizhouensis TaxID=885475 RepID=UPI0015FFBEB8|nr:protein kinase [Salipaludibacillus neizhouensis]